MKPPMNTVQPGREPKESHRSLSCGPTQVHENTVPLPVARASRPWETRI